MNQKLILLILIFISLIITIPNLSGQQVSVGFDVFYNELSPYGRWIDNPQYGQVWIPEAVPGFKPYSTAGHWVLTDYGWTWFSDYKWGWAPFHYGRWMFEPAIGWMWVPGYEWGPAWVVWRRAPGYYGWAPLEPGISINIAMGNSYVLPHERWVFVQDRYIANPNPGRFFLNVSLNLGIFRRSSLIIGTHMDNTRHVNYFWGPDRAEVEKIRGKRINSVVLHDFDRPGHNFSKGNYWLYRPEMRQGSFGNVPRNGSSFGGSKNPRSERAGQIQPKHNNPGIQPQKPTNFKNHDKGSFGGHTNGNHEKKENGRSERK